MTRNDKLRLCLRYRKACLIDLAYSEVTEVREWGNSDSCNIDRDTVTYYYLNFKNSDDMDLFKTDVENVAINTDIIGIFIINEGSFGFEEIKNYSKHFGRLNNLVLEIRSHQFFHHVSRKRLQDMLMQLITVPPSFPCLDINDIIMTIREGRNFYTGNYPSHAGEPNIGLTATVKLLLHQMNLLEKDNLVLIIMIHENPKLDCFMKTEDGLRKEFDMFKDFFYGKFEYAVQGLYYFLFDSEMEVPMRVSIIATDRLV